MLIKSSNNTSCSQFFLLNTLTESSNRSKKCFYFDSATKTFYSNFVIKKIYNTSSSSHYSYSAYFTHTITHDETTDSSGSTSNNNQSKDKVNHGYNMHHLNSKESNRISANERYFKAALDYTIESDYLVNTQMLFKNGHVFGLKSQINRFNFLDPLVSFNLSGCRLEPCQNEEEEGLKRLKRKDDGDYYSLENLKYMNTDLRQMIDVNENQLNINLSLNIEITSKKMMNLVYNSLFVCDFKFGYGLINYKQNIAMKYVIFYKIMF
jgi:hypothetical protein